MHRNSICPCGCGHPAAETLKPEAQGPVFVPAQTVCQARMRLLESQRGVAEERGIENAPARLWSIEMRKR
jgi:hypothetical protein